MANDLKDVEKFWDRNLCGRHFIKARYPSKEFFDEYIEFRYRKEHHLGSLIEWEKSRNKDVLEIGLGIGADGTKWAKYANSYTGVDLTDESVRAATLLFKLRGLNGNILKGNAESLVFNDNKFDLIYSYGVLHHTPNIGAALKEIYRVLRPNGEFVLMLYSKESFNYWFRIQFYFRIRFLFELIKHKLGLKSVYPWNIHIKNFGDYGCSYFAWDKWYHRCTEGPDCMISNIYYKNEIVDLLKKTGFFIDKMKKVHFPITNGKCPRIEGNLAKYIGFYRLIWARKIV